MRLRAPLLQAERWTSRVSSTKSNGEKGVKDCQEGLTVTGAQDAIESALKESQRLRKALLKDSGKQVRSDDEKQVAKATAQSWFHSHRAIITAILDDDSVKAIDE